MKYVLLLCGLLLGRTALFGQCAISVQLSNDTGCGPGDWFSVNTTGGTAPFNIVVERHSLIAGGWQTVVSAPADADGVLAGNFNLYATDGLRVTVTDALGCVATQTNTFQAYAVVGSYVMYDNDPCTGMNIVRYQIVGTNCSPSYLMATHTLIIDGTPLGLISETCTHDGTDFQINQQLPNGTHEIMFSGPSCIPGGVLWCWVPVSFTLENPYVGDCGVNFQLRAALDGALSSGTVMSDALRTANLVPAVQPYTALGYSFVGSPTAVSTSPAVLAVTGNNAIVDWVVAELRSANAPYSIVYSKPALLQRDGDVIDADGNPYVNFPVTPGNYRIALRHRNHLGVMTDSPRPLSLYPNTLVDLQLGSTTTYGTNARVLKNGVWCLWAGDVTFDGAVKYVGPDNDRDPILQAIGGSTPTNVLSNVYHRADTNMDGIVRYVGANNDRDVILQTIGGSVPTNIRLAQLP